MTDSGADACLLRDASPADVPDILRLLRGLASYQSMLERVETTEHELAEAFFGVPPRAHAIVVERGGITVAMAIYYFAFVAYAGRPVLFVDQLFVDAGVRGQGIGAALFRDLARRARAAKCLRMEWLVMDWNAAAIRFYNRIGAEPLPPMEGITVQRLGGAALDTLADAIT